ncbi:hypothetical protein C8J57DRAFT_1224604 [Mycena rebaudengoi]|nr:hypothetical protein C8J57DRAFT_1224604 [Mycena rebaudengoi]
MFFPKSVLLALAAFVAATNAVALDQRCHLTNGQCNPFTAENCPLCCFPEQCKKKNSSLSGEASQTALPAGFKRGEDRYLRRVLAWWAIRPRPPVPIPEHEDWEEPQQPQCREGVRKGGCWVSFKEHKRKRSARRTGG